MSNKKQLFKPTSVNDIKNRIKAGNEMMCKKSAYIFGYYESANLLAEYVIKETRYDSQRDCLFYPICFNYRHYIEIHLKSIIESSKILYEKMELLGYLKNGNMPESVNNKIQDLHKTHNLLELLELLKYCLFYIKISNEAFPKDIEKYIKQMHDTDTNGQKYRYYENKSSKLHFPKEEIFDINNIKNIMSEVNTTLWAIDDFISCYLDVSNEIIRDLKNEMMAE